MCYNLKVLEIMLYPFTCFSGLSPWFGCSLDLASLCLDAVVVSSCKKSRLKIACLRILLEAGDDLL